MNTSITVSSAPGAEPVLLADVLESLEVASGFADDKITAMIEAARQDVERYTTRALITQTLTMYLDKFPGYETIYLPYAPVQSVTSVKYYDTSGSQQTLVADTDYFVTTTGNHARIEPSDSGWPSVDTEKNERIEVIYVAGYGASGANVPGALKQAILMHIDWQYSKGMIDDDLWKKMCDSYIAYFDWNKNE